MQQYPFYSIKRLINSVVYSIEGLVAVFKSEAAFRLELFVIICYAVFIADSIYA
jgi:diacylglycerol kinase